MSIYKIISVEIVGGKIFNQRWNSPMQKITTDKGVFIDNEPGRSFGNFSHGYDWKLKVGKTVQAKITNNSNNEWISFESGTVENIKGTATPHDNLATTSNLAKNLGIGTKELTQKLVDCGYLEEQDGKYQLTAKGSELGGRSRTNKYGPYFMWPLTLKI